MDELLIFVDFIPCPPAIVPNNDCIIADAIHLSASNELFSIYKEIMNIFISFCFEIQCFSIITIPIFLYSPSLQFPHLMKILHVFDGPVLEIV